MSYQVLARKWRPHRFADLVGQAHVVRALVNALDHNRIHHAFLFSGTRGVGKTTIARIFAKSLNCEAGVGSTPCGECKTCLEVDAGRFVDLIEVDAASRTKVDDTRELLDNVQYAPTRGRYKVYLIDEVHMLSGHSFNALLKTLEEPPPHVKFLLATTDPQKLPVTVLSRCLQFNLKRLEPAQIAAQLEKILGAENIPFDAASLALLARAADGSMRDGLSLLDQAIAYGGGVVAATEVRDMLGTIDQDSVARLLAALAAGDVVATLQVVAATAQQHIDYDDILKELLLQFHRISLAQTAPAALPVLQDTDAALARDFATRFTPEDVQLFYQIGALGRRDLALAPDARTGLEMTLLRMLAFRPARDETAATGPTKADAVPARAAKPTAAYRDIGAPTVPAVKVGVGESSPAAPAPITPTPTRTTTPNNATTPTSEWTQLAECLSLTGLVRELAFNSTLVSMTDDAVVLNVDPACANLNNKERAAAIGAALGKHFGRAVRVDIRVASATVSTPARERQREQEQRQQAAVAAIGNDPNVRALQESFNARVNPASIKAK